MTAKFLVAVLLLSCLSSIGLAANTSPQAASPSKIKAGRKAEAQKTQAHDLGSIRPGNLVLPHFAVSTLRSPEKIGGIIERDLVLADIVSQPEQKTLADEARRQDQRDKTISFDAWTAAGVHYVLLCDYQEASVVAHLYDIASRQHVFGRSYQGVEQGQERRVAHQIADDVITALTNRPGIFSSLICALLDVGQGNKEVVIMHPDGGDIQQLTNEQSILATPAWGKNGGEIYFTSYRDNNPDLVGITLQGERFEISRRPGLNTSPSWNESRQRLAVTLSKDGNCEIYTMTRDGRNAQRLTENSDADTAPDWSPDGSQIVFTSDRDGTPEIYIMGADGSDPTKISHESYCDSPVWSPDGNKIAYVVRQKNEFNIYLYNTKTGNVTQLTNGQGQNCDPSWAPDSRHLVFASDRGGTKGLYIMDIETRQAHCIARGNFSSPAWGPLFRR